MRIIITLGLVLALSACSGGSGSSRLNPLTWFGGGGSKKATTLGPRDGYIVTRDTRPMISQITTLSIERTSVGVIVHATGLPPTQAFHTAGLVLVASDKTDELAFEFRTLPPLEPRRSGTNRSREISVATFLTRHQMAGIRRITVRAAGNSRTARR